MERKYYDLSAAQKILLYSQKYTIHKQVNNVCTSVLLDKKLDFDILKKAICLAYKRNDCFTIRLVKIEKETKQYFGEYEEPSIEYLDFRGQTFEKMEKKLYKIAHKRITNFEKQMSKIYMMHSYDGKSGIYFVVSHMILDSWSISTFFKDLLSIYNSIEKGLDMPKPRGSYEELLIHELNYKDTEQYKKDRKYFEELFEDTTEPIFTHINGSAVLEQYRKKKKDPNLRYAQVFSLRTKAENKMLPFSKELVTQMEEFCVGNKVSMQSLILFAYRSYFSKVNDNEKDIFFYTVVARRSTLLEKNTGGSRVHFMPFRTIFNESTTFKNACETISELQTSIFRHVAMDPLEVMDIWKENFNIPPIGTYSISSVTYQPVKLKSPDGTYIETKWYGNGASGNPLYLTVMDGDGTGGLKFYYEYQTHCITLDTIKDLHSYMMQVIEFGTLNQDTTIEELLKIDSIKENDSYSMEYQP